MALTPDSSAGQTLNDHRPSVPLQYRTQVPRKPGSDRAGWTHVVVQLLAGGVLLYYLGGTTGWGRVLQWFLIVAAFAFAGLAAFVAVTSGGGPNTVARRLLAATERACEAEGDVRPLDLAAAGRRFDLALLARQTAELEPLGFRGVGDFHNPSVERAYRNVRGFHRTFLDAEGKIAFYASQTRLVGHRQAKRPVPAPATAASSMTRDGRVLVTSAVAAHQTLANPPHVHRELVAAGTPIDLVLKRHRERMAQWEVGGGEFKRVGSYEELRVQAGAERDRSLAFHRARGWLRGVDVLRISQYEVKPLQEKIADELERIWHHETRPALVTAGVEPVDNASLGAMQACESADRCVSRTA